MKIPNVIKDNINLILIATLIFSIKPLEFLAINLSVANFADDLVYPMIFHLLIFSIYIAILILSLNFKKVLVNKFFIFLAAIYYFQYFALDIRDFMLAWLPILVSQTLLLLISIFLIIFISFLFTHYYFRSKNKHVFIFGASLLCLSQVVILLSNLNYLSDVKKGDQVSVNLSLREVSIDSDISGENVYYIILDGLVSYEYFSDVSDIKNTTFHNFNDALEDQDFRVFQDSLSSYNMTYLTLGSILEMDYYDKDLTYNNRDNFFPKSLYKKEPPKLLKNLNNIGYEFIYSGNPWAQCKNSINFSCGNRIIDYDSLSFSKKLLQYTNNAGIQTFTSRSILGFILRALGSVFGSSFYDDGLTNFMESGIDSIEPNSKKFYFIHNEAPHPPYPENNCEIDHTKSYTGWISMEAYSFSISCALNKTLSSIDKILEIDPSAIIVVQGDHGTSLNYDWMQNPLKIAKEDIKERFSIFNSVKIPKRCDSINSNSIGNVQTINLVFDCISNTKRVDLGSKSFAGVYEDNREFFGRLYEVTDNLK
jgi:hypothetical protein